MTVSIPIGLFAALASTVVGESLPATTSFSHEFVVLLLGCPAPPVSVATVPSGWRSIGRRDGIDPDFSTAQRATIGV